MLDGACLARVECWIRKGFDGVTFQRMTTDVFWVVVRVSYTDLVRVVRRNPKISQCGHNPYDVEDLTESDLLLTAS